MGLSFVGAIYRPMWQNEPIVPLPTLRGDLYLFIRYL